MKKKCPECNNLTSVDISLKDLFSNQPKVCRKCNTTSTLELSWKHYISFFLYVGFIAALIFFPFPSARTDEGMYLGMIIVTLSSYPALKYMTYLKKL